MVYIKAKSILLIGIILISILTACTRKETPQTESYSNTVNYGMYNKNNSLIDVGTSLTNSNEFSGYIEVNQDIRGTYIYYLNILSNGIEIPYTIDNDTTISATEFELSDKQSIKKKLILNSLKQGEEVTVLLFKYPAKQSALTVDSSLGYSVMGLRFNIGSPTIPKTFQIKDNAVETENNADFVLLEPDTNPPKVAINQSVSSKVQLTIGKNDDQNDIPDRNFVLAFLNGKKIELNSNFNETVYQIHNGTSINIPITLPSKDQVQRYGDIFQMVSILSPFEMTNGINSQTNINFTNPIQIKIN